MTPEMQKEAMATLAEVWSLAPDLRLGQLLAHVGFLGEVYLGRGLGYLDDDEILAILYRHKAELLARLQGAEGPSPVSGEPGMSLSGSPTLVSASTTESGR